MSATGAHRVAASTLVALALLCVTWELWLAPLRPGGSWLAVKVLPLLPALSGVLRRRLYTYRWSTMLVLAYFAEGLVRVYVERGMASTLAAIEIALAVIFFASAVAYIRTQTNP